MLANNKIVMNIAKRAERKGSDYLIKSFVQLDNVFPTLCLEENQLIYGRRGTGKTHLLKYLSSQLINDDEHVIDLDMRLLGSTCGIYSDSNLPIMERTARLFCDLLCNIHEALVGIVQDVSGNEDFNFSEAVLLLDQFLELVTNVSIDGNKEVESSYNQAVSSSNTKTAKFLSTPSCAIEFNRTDNLSSTDGTRVKNSGVERRKIHIGSVTRALRKIVDLLPQKKLWILLDEWSEIPIELQPYLADSIKRTIFSVISINIKIAAIEHRCQLRLYNSDKSIGIEVSAEASSSINLDEFMVFDNDRNKAINFFGQLIHKHSMALEPTCNSDCKSFLLELFASSRAFEEFVRAAEGIPRDGLHIISNAVLHNPSGRISVTAIRESASRWFNTNKSKDVNSNSGAIQMLDWIINKVIGQRHSRGFLLKLDTKDEIIDFLYDSRIIHLVKQGVSAKSHRGKRFSLYALDYGCYADLLATKDEPKGLIIDDSQYVEIPKIDFRSVKDAILDLQEYKSSSTLPLFETTDDIYLHAKHTGKVQDDYSDSNFKIINSLPPNIGSLKLKNTVYIPIVFIGLVIRDNMGFKKSTGAEITQAYNENVAKNEQRKKANNISRALRDNKTVMDEQWLVIDNRNSNPLFSLSDNWEDHWENYFCPNNTFKFN